MLDELAPQLPTVEIDLAFEIELLGDRRAGWRNGEMVVYDEDMPR